MSNSKYITQVYVGSILIISLVVFLICFQLSKSGDLPREVEAFIRALFVALPLLCFIPIDILFHQCLKRLQFNLIHPPVSLSCFCILYALLFEQSSRSHYVIFFLAASISLLLSGLLTALLNAVHCLLRRTSNQSIQETL